MSRVEIRAATTVDAKAILPLLEAYWAFEGTPGFDSDTLNRRLVEFLSNRAYGLAWVAQDADRLVGYLLAAFVFSFEYGGRMAEVDEFFVEEASRGRGIGRRMLETARHALQREECAALQLQVADDNRPAQKFYSSFGFRPKQSYRLWTVALPTS
jgi:ribosomal protein S18 acetylase RimI-like enzyme